jgi:membrane protein implicated in regulation of membrane protease activity
VPLILNIIISTVVAILISIFVYRLEKYVKEKKLREKENKSYLIGNLGIVISEIKENETGQIEIDHSGQKITLQAKGLEGGLISTGKMIIIADLDDEMIPLVSENIPI